MLQLNGGIFNNFPVSTMNVKSKPLRILKIGMGQKLLVCQTTYMRKVHKPSLLWTVETYLFKNCFTFSAHFQITVPGVWWHILLNKRINETENIIHNTSELRWPMGVTAQTKPAFRGASKNSHGTSRYEIVLLVQKSEQPEVIAVGLRYANESLTQNSKSPDMKTTQRQR